jgi:hypothetical protein
VEIVMTRLLKINPVFDLDRRGPSQSAEEGEVM